jgi:hypothetical protein
MVSLTLSAQSQTQIQIELNKEQLDANITNKIRYVQVTFYQAKEDQAFDQLDPVYDLSVIGHKTVQIWYAPAGVLTQPIVTQGTVTKTATTITVPVTSDQAAKVYWMAFASATATPTVNDLISQSSASVIGSNKGVISLTAATPANIEATSLTTNTAYKVHYIVIGNDGILASAVVSVTETPAAG